MKKSDGAWITKEERDLVLHMLKMTDHGANGPGEIPVRRMRWARGHALYKKLSGSSSLSDEQIKKVLDEARVALAEYERKQEEVGQLRAALIKCKNLIHEQHTSLDTVQAVGKMVAKIVDDAMESEGGE